MFFVRFRYYPFFFLCQEVEDCYDEPIQTPPLEEIYSKRSKQVQFTVGATTQDNISHTESSAFDRRQSYGTTNAISFR